MSGVFEAPPSNATDQFDIIFPFSLYFDTYKDQYGMNLWYSNNPYTYVILKKGVDPDILNKRIKDFAKEKFKAAHGTEGLEVEGIMFLQQYSDKYLFTGTKTETVDRGRIEYVRLFFIIGSSCLQLPV